MKFCGYNVKIAGKIELRLQVQRYEISSKRARVSRGDFANAEIFFVPAERAEKAERIPLFSTEPGDGD